MKYGGLGADLNGVLSQTLDAVGRYGRDILDGHPLTCGSTLMFVRMSIASCYTDMSTAVDVVSRHS